MRCPLCNGETEHFATLGCFVCGRCSEMLAKHELVKEATRRTRREYVARTYPNLSRELKEQMGYT